MNHIHVLNPHQNILCAFVLVLDSHQLFHPTHPLLNSIPESRLCFLQLFLNLLCPGVHRHCAHESYTCLWLIILKE